jgi:hypothetical protein
LRGKLSPGARDKSDFTPHPYKNKKEQIKNKKNIFFIIISLIIPPEICAANFSSAKQTKSDFDILCRLFAGAAGEVGK